jgi:hypothetical protein
MGTVYITWPRGADIKDNVCATRAPILAALSVSCNLRKLEPLLVRQQFGRMVRKKIPDTFSLV